MSKFIVMQLELYYNEADVFFHGEKKQTQNLPADNSSTRFSKYNILNNISKNTDDLYTSLITYILTKTMQTFQEGTFLIQNLLFFYGREIEKGAETAVRLNEPLKIYVECEVTRILKVHIEHICAVHSCVKY